MAELKSCVLTVVRLTVCVTFTVCCILCVDLCGQYGSLAHAVSSIDSRFRLGSSLLEDLQYVLLRP